MRHIQIILSYDGSAYGGFQRQINARTVQEEVESCLERLTGEKTTVYFVARTDAGVHAYGQVCTFYTESSIPGERFLPAMNIDLPDDIRVMEAREVPCDFSARKKNTGKTYAYLLSEERETPPFLRRYAWRTGCRLHREAMESGARLLTGTRDFTSFRGTNSVTADPVRTVYDIRIVRDGSWLRLYVTGKGFLYHMVRNMVGALVDVGRGRLNETDLVRILEAKDRRQLGMTAPAQGLCLLHVYFGEVTKEAIDTVLHRKASPWTLS